MDSTVPTVTPRMAPAALISTPWPSRRKYQARDNPMVSLQMASSTWEMAVGFMFPWPWV